MARTRVIGYVRVSSEQQASDGVSLDAQRARLEAYCVAMDLDLVRVEVDAGISASSLRRPGLQSSLASLGAGEADGLLVAKLDRLTRSVRDLGWLLEPDRFGGRWQLLSVADSLDTRSAAGRLVLHVLGAVSQWEREATGERTREALAHLKAKGVRLGRPALGWTRTNEVDDEGRQVIAADDDELATVARIRELRAAGLSLRAVAARLTAEGRPSKRGGAWQPMTVARVLARAA